MPDAGKDLKGALEALRDELGMKSTQQFPAATGLPDEPVPPGTLTDDAVAVSVARKLPENAIVCDEAITSAGALSLCRPIQRRTTT